MALFPERKEVMTTTFDSETKIWSGPERKSSFDPNTSLGEVIFNQLSKNPSNIIQIHDSEDVKLTNKEVLRMSCSIAESLLELKITQDDVIGIIASNTSYLMPVCFGCFFIGVPFSSVNADLGEAIIKHCWSTTKPKIIFCDGDVLELVERVVGNLNLGSLIFTLNGDSGNSVVKLLNHNLPNFVPHKIPNGDHIAIIPFSSGSTGYPKAICKSHRSCLETADQMNDDIDDIILTILPIYWLSGLYGIIGSGVSGCTHLVTKEYFSPSTTVYLIRKYKVTKIFVVPPFISEIVNHPETTSESLSSLKVIKCSGCRLYPDIYSKFKSLLPRDCKIFNRYGCTEFGAMAMTFRNESDMYLRPNIKARIVDSNGNNLGVNELGQIVIFSKNPWKGHFNDPLLTSKAYKDGWYRTGDTGYFDDQGILYIVDRINDNIKMNGFHFAPSEVESVIYEMEGIREVCVLGLENRILVAAVVKEDYSNVDEDNILRHVAMKLEQFKHLHKVVFLENIIKNSSGKVLRKDMMELVRELVM